MKFGSLFAGAGGFDLGLERAGMICEWQVEIDEFARKILAQHWPTVPKFGDVRECGAHNLAAVDLICGGFPCQDISNAGKRAGMDGERSGLWREFYRIICELRPRFIIVENVSDLLVRGMDRVLRDLAEGGYDAEWSVLSACSMGAPHTRERVFIVAYPAGLNVSLAEVLREKELPRESGRVGDTLPGTYWQTHQPEIVGMARWTSAEMESVKRIGNIVVPQVAEWIGKRIMDYEQQQI